MKHVWMILFFCLAGMEISTAQTLDKPKLILERSGSVIRDFNFSPDGKKLVVCDHTGIVAWNLEDGTAWFTLPKHANFYSAVLTEDNKNLYIGGNNQIILWDTDTQRELEKFDQGLDYNARVSRMQTTLDGKWIVYLGVFINSPLVLFQRENHLPFATLRSTFGFENLYRAMYAISPDANCIAVMDGRSSIQLWNLREHKTWFFEVRIPQALGFSFDSSTLYVAERRNKNIIRYDTQTGGREGEIAIPTDSRVFFSPDGRYVISQSSLWDVQSGQNLGALNLTLLLERLLFSPGNEWLAELYAGQQIHIWDIRPLTGKTAVQNFSWY